MYNHHDDATLFADKFMTDNAGKQLVSTQLRLMLSHPATNRKQLSEKLLRIGRSYIGDNDKMVKSINILFSGFLTDLYSPNPIDEIETFQGTDEIETFQGTDEIETFQGTDEFIEIIQSLMDAKPQLDSQFYCNIRREMRKNGDQGLHGFEIAPPNMTQHQINTGVTPFFAWSEKYIYFLTDIWDYNRGYNPYTEYRTWYALNSLPIRPITGTCPRIIFKVGSESINEIETLQGTDEIETFQGTSDERIEKVQSLLDAFPPSEYTTDEIEFRHNIRSEMHKNGNRRLHGLEIAPRNITQQKIDAGVTPFFAWSYTHIYFMRSIHGIYYGINSTSIFEYALDSIPRHPGTRTFPRTLEGYTY